MKLGNTILLLINFCILQLIYGMEMEKVPIQEYLYVKPNQKLILPAWSSYPGSSSSDLSSAGSDVIESIYKDHLSPNAPLPTSPSQSNTPSRIKYSSSRPSSSSSSMSQIYEELGVSSSQSPYVHHSTSASEFIYALPMGIMNPKEEQEHQEPEEVDYHEFMDSMHDIMSDAKDTILTVPGNVGSLLSSGMSQMSKLRINNALPFPLPKLPWSKDEEQPIVYYGKPISIKKMKKSFGKKNINKDKPNNSINNNFKQQQQGSNFIGSRI